MDGFSHELISRIVDPPKSGDYPKKNEAPDRVQRMKDQHRRDRQNQRRHHQKFYTDDDPHVDLQA